jgi:DNA-binding CsgD family transcriptional regulator
VQLFGRRAECAAIDELLAAIRAGSSRCLVLHGAPGIGKTALLNYLAERASDCRVLRAAGVESEMELAFAGLQQLCGPVAGDVDRLLAPQRDALRTAFGMMAGPPPDRFLVALAVLSLLSDITAEQPMICLVDDEQWLDTASAQVLAFVARRLMAESSAIVFAARLPSDHLDDLPELVVSALPNDAAAALLDSVLPGPLDAQVREQIVVETRGNPLAILELPRGLTPAELAGGFGLPGVGRFSGSVEENYRQRLSALPEPTRLLLLLASAETAGDSALLWRAAALLGIPVEAASAAADAELAELGDSVRFRHPLVRSAAYTSASVHDRQTVHRALAEAIDANADADRRAWHLAHSRSAPDDDVAAELERSAGRAQARGGLAAAAVFLERATTMTLDRSLRTGRALAAASASLDAGAFGAAQQLLTMARMGPLSDFQRAKLDMIRAQLAFASNRGNDAPPLLSSAAKRLEDIDLNLARATYLDAFSASLFAGRLAVGGGAWEIARLAGAAPPAPGVPRPHDLLLDGLAANYNHGYAAGVPLLRDALSTFGGVTEDEELRWLACVAAIYTWDDQQWDALSERHVARAREIGALNELPLALSSRAYFLLFAGDIPAAASLVEELHAVTEVTGSSLAPYGALGLAAFRGSSAEVGVLSESTLRDASARGEGNGMTSVWWANGVLNNGCGHYDEAREAADLAGGYAGDIGGSVWNPVELVEAAVRSGREDVAASAQRRVREMASASGTDWIRGLEARTRALLSEHDTAEGLYREALERLGRTRMRADLARAHLLYGEWLRRERRRGEAREQLRRAHGFFEDMGMAGFAERARRELLVTGETARRRVDSAPRSPLTPQEGQVARLARDGLTNPEIGARLFISTRTVQYHLRKVFAKLDITSRGQLEVALPEQTTGVTG